MTLRWDRGEWVPRPGSESLRFGPGRAGNGTAGRPDTDSFRSKGSFWKR